VLVEAVEQLGGPYHLVLVGGGGPVPQGERIRHIPFRRDQRQLARLLASCDVLVHPGDGETFGLIVLEAMACGLPVVATNAGGVAELVDAGTGILAEPNDAASLAGAIEAIYARDLQRMGEAARRKAAGHYDWNEILPQVMKRYDGLLAGYPRMTGPSGAPRDLRETDRIYVTDHYVD
jgi:alpha-1,6-mannosyltransferase